MLWNLFHTGHIWNQIFFHALTKYDAVILHCVGIFYHSVYKDDLWYVVIDDMEVLSTVDTSKGAKAGF